MSAWPLRGAVLALLLLLGWGVGSSLRGSRAQAWEPRSAKSGQTPRLRVLCTIFPLYDFAREIGGDAVEVRCLLPPGVDPHEFALSPKDWTTLSPTRS
jgi:ABC-type Zn uptake system ZnuABC Zn-binding protein ZnuA